MKLPNKQKKNISKFPNKQQRKFQNSETLKCKQETGKPKTEQTKFSKTNTIRFFNLNNHFQTNFKKVCAHQQFLPLIHKISDDHY